MAKGGAAIGAASDRISDLAAKGQAGCPGIGPVFIVTCVTGQDFAAGHDVGVEHET